MADLPKDTIFHYHSEDGVTIKVDAIPLVRCKDCQWFDKNGDYYDAYCDKNGIAVDDDFYCADGERKDGAEC